MALRLIDLCLIYLCVISRYSLCLMVRHQMAPECLKSLSELPEVVSLDAVEPYQQEEEEEGLGFGLWGFELTATVYYSLPRVI